MFELQYHFILSSKIDEFVNPCFVAEEKAALPDEVFDALGSVRLSGAFQLSEGAYSQTIPFDLPAGIYTIRLRTGAFNTSKIIIVAH